MSLFFLKDSQVLLHDSLFLWFFLERLENKECSPVQVFLLFKSFRSEMGLGLAKAWRVFFASLCSFLESLFWQSSVRSRYSTTNALLEYHSKLVYFTLFKVSQKSLKSVHVSRKKGTWKMWLIHLKLTIETFRGYQHY